MVAIYLWAVALFTIVGVASSVDPIHIPLKRTSRIYKSISRRAVAGSVQLYNAVQQGAYAIDLSIGTPGQNFTVILDTGSTELWVPGPNCPKTQCFGTLFNTQASSTYVATSDPISLVYGVGSDNGTYGRDTVTLGGYQVQNLSFGVISSAANSSVPVNGEPYLNGILGLAFPALTYAYKTHKAQYDPFIFALWKQNQIPQPIFSIYLGPRTAAGETGLVTFGGIDNTKYSGNLQYLQVQMETYPNITANYYHWNILLLGLAATVDGKQSSNFLGTSGETVALDTGTTLSYMPQDLVASMLKVIAPNAIYIQGIYVVDCNLASSTGTLDFAFGNATGNSSTTILRAPISSFVLPADSASIGTAQNCIWGIIPINIQELGTYLLGDTFLQSFYVVHDFENHTIGMASAPWTNLSSGSSVAVTTATGNNSGANSGNQSNSGSANLKSVTCLTFALVACVSLFLL